MLCVYSGKDPKICAIHFECVEEDIFVDFTEERFTEVKDFASKWEHLDCLQSQVAKQFLATPPDTALRQGYLRRPGNRSHDEPGHEDQRWHHWLLAKCSCSPQMDIIPP